MYKQDKEKGYIEIKSESPKDKVKRLIGEAEEILTEYTGSKFSVDGKAVIEVAKLLQEEENRK